MVTFISYSYATPSGYGFGMCEADTIPRTLDDVKNIARQIEAVNGWPEKCVVILNWKKF